MKRLIRKAEPVLAPIDIEIGDATTLDADPKYQGLDMNDMSIPSNRDGAVLIDSKENVIRWGLNGETHEDLYNKYYADIIQDMNKMKYETDDYVTPGVYLKDFLGYESILLYNDDDSTAENVIVNNKPGTRVYVDDWDGEVQRLASIRNKFRRVG